MSAGIDYGLGCTNIDVETGIRYGCISIHSVTQAWDYSAESDYGEPTCPKCGNIAGNAEDARASIHGIDQYSFRVRGSFDAGGDEATLSGRAVRVGTLGHGQADQG
mgnify:CR=1 FL=1